MHAALFSNIRRSEAIADFVNETSKKKGERKKVKHHFYRNLHAPVS